VLVGKRAPALDPRRVVVASFEDLSGDPTLAPLGHIAAEWVTQALARHRGVEVVPGTAPSRLEPADIRALAARTGAGTVISGSYYRAGDSVRFHLQIIDAARGTVRRGVEPVGAPRQAPVQAAEALRQRVTAVFDTLFPPVSQ
jgi:TolB-like protein